MSFANSTHNIIDLSINKSIDFIAATVYQLFQLIFCLVFIIFVGKIVSIFVSNTAPTENEVANLKLDVEATTEPEENENEEKLAEKELTGWESEPIPGDPIPPTLEIPSSNVSAKVMKKQYRRKCLSVGPIMLTPNSQIIRTLNVEEREERYRYDILPLDTPKDDPESAANVCVPCANKTI